MKITIEVDCTPEEARAFLGLPDMAQMQQQFMKAFQEQMAGDPEAAMKSWMGPGLQGLTDLQKAYWDQMTKPADKKSK